MAASNHWAKSAPALQKEKADESEAKSVSVGCFFLVGRKVCGFFSPSRSGRGRSAFRESEGNLPPKKTTRTPLVLLAIPTTPGRPRPMMMMMKPPSSSSCEWVWTAMGEEEEERLVFFVGGRGEREGGKNCAASLFLFLFSV